MLIPHLRKALFVGGHLNLMLKKSIFWIFALILFSCKRAVKVNSVPKEKGLLIVCENEKYLIENINNNLEYSFDSVLSTKSYWKHVKFAQFRSGHKLYPYVILKLDTPSLYQNIKISLIGEGEWKYDSRLITAIDESQIDSNWIINFFERISLNSDTTEVRYRPELLLAFYNDSIIDISRSLKKLTQIYISFQKMNSIRLFNMDLCSLTKMQLDSIKKSVPYRIRLGRHG